MKNEKQNTQCLVTGQFYDPEIEFAKIMNEKMETKRPAEELWQAILAAQDKLEEAKECFLDLTEKAFELVLAEQRRAKEKARHDSKDAVEREHYKSTIIQECLRQIRKDENGLASDAIGRIAEYFGVE